MGWLQRIFGGGNQAAPEATAATPMVTADVPAESIPPERVGLNGEYDQSGLAKRVAQAFDQDAAVADIDTVWVAQLTGEVVLKGKVPSQDILNRLVEIARAQSGATGVNVEQVEVG
ncbi:BON domain-containing protein [Alkalinema sp. FACHB-956]|uniref:BON domain-containing protein n=1 Tax=Alkalinema sp. FACHB-956 TaxID=2692768 RepID=UPI001685FEA0|nr:BON domain-containing protein [Alkalinema sp. FACHB-956]MBD2326626.1 BON domain-containing protein [Alkalinema sp. FACHB-956]